MSKIITKIRIPTESASQAGWATVLPKREHHRVSPFVGLIIAITL